MQMYADKAKFDLDGFVLIEDVVDAKDVIWMCEELSALDHPAGDRLHHGKTFAVRDVFAASPPLLQFARSEALAGLALTLLGSEAWPTKATLFDKHADANWALPLHQDLTITVQARAEVPGFGPWTEKAGVPHVRPPEWVLQSTVALRIHLDDCPNENGALHVVRASHRRGRLSTDALKAVMSDLASESVPANAGDVLAMSPLTLHASGKSTNPNRRRVLHIEYASIDLPDPLRWPSWVAQSEPSLYKHRMENPVE